MSDAEGGARRRRHRSRSGGRRHHHSHRRREGHSAGAEQPPRSSAPPATWNPGAPDPQGNAAWRAGRGGGPPEGWHGNSGGGAGLPPQVGAPPPQFGVPPGGVPLLGYVAGPPPGHHPPPVYVATPPPDYRYEGVHEDPYAAFAAVPPPPCLHVDNPYGSGRGRGGWKGRGKGKGADAIENDGGAPRPNLPDGLIVSNVPADQCTLSVLNRHFRQFGEVLRITVQTEEGPGRAFVQFAESNSAEAALRVSVLDNPEIGLSRAARKGKGKGKDKGKNKDKDGKPSATETTNRTFFRNPDDERKSTDASSKRAEITAKKNKLLGGLTEQLKMIMTKLNDQSLNEAKRDALRALLVTIKVKMDALTTPEKTFDHDEGTGPVGKRPGEDLSSTPQKKIKKAATPTKEPSYFLDLRPRVLQVTIKEGWTQDRLREELQKLDVGPDQVQDILWGMSSDGKPSEEFSLIRFSDRKHGERLLNRKVDLPFTLEWCTNQSLPPPASPLVLATSPQVAPSPIPECKIPPLEEEASVPASAAASADDSAEAGVDGKASEGVVSETQAVVATQADADAATATPAATESAPDGVEKTAKKPGDVDLSEEEDEDAAAS